MSTKHAHSDELFAIIEPVCVGAGYELVELEFRGDVLRVFIDFPPEQERGISFDDCAQLSHELSAVLDVEDPISQKYSLEVSSPGIDRPLRTAEHFQRVLGQEAKVALHNGIDGRRNFKGIVAAVAADATTLTITVDGNDCELPLADLASAKLVPDWDALMKGQGNRARG